MTPVATIRLTAGLVGGLLVALNTLQLTMGVVRLNRALSEETISTRLADPLRTGWVLSSSLGLLLGILLLFLLPELGGASYVAWKATTVTAIGLVLVGIAAVLATGRHYGLLFISAMGLALLAPLLAWRSHFQ